MKCPKCGSDNPDYSFFCGRCAAELKAPATEGAQAKPSRRMPTINSMLSRRLLTIENNIQRKGKGIFARFRVSFARGGQVAFKSDVETVTLVISKDHHASLVNGPVDKPSVTFEGPHGAFLEMFPDRGGFGHLPSSVAVIIAGSNMTDPVAEKIYRDLGEAVLKDLFKEEA